MKWYIKALKQYADFSGRASRIEFWMFVLFNFIFLSAAVFIDNLLRLTIYDLPYGIFYFLLVIASLIPSLALTVRRLHDTGKSGRMIFISLIPLVGGLWLFVLMLTSSAAGENKYGVNPAEAMVEKNKTTKGVAIFLISALVFWIFSNVYNSARMIVQAGWEYAKYNPIDFIINQLYMILPIAFLVFLISALQKGYKQD